MRKIWIAGLTASVALLAACSGESSVPAAPEPATSSNPVASPEAASSAPAPSSAAPTPAAVVKDPCDVISVKEMEKIADTKIKSKKSAEVMGTTLCTYTPESLSDATVTTQGDQLSGNFDTLVAQVQKQFDDDEPTKITIAGADDAVVLTGKLSGVNAVDVIAAKGGVWYQALTAGTGDTKDYRKAMTTVVERLLAA